MGASADDTIGAGAKTAPVVIATSFGSEGAASSATTTPFEDTAAAAAGAFAAAAAADGGRSKRDFLRCGCGRA